MNKRIIFNVEPELHRLIKRTAKRQSLTMTAFVKAAIFDELQRKSNEIGEQNGHNAVNQGRSE